MIHLSDLSEVSNLAVVEEWRPEKTMAPLCETKELHGNERLEVASLRVFGAGRWQFVRFARRVSVVGIFFGATAAVGTAVGCRVSHALE